MVLRTHGLIVGLSWALANLRALWGGLAAFALTIPVVWWMDPSVDPIPPAVAPVSGATADEMSPESDGGGADFVFRPLFLAGRRSLAPADVETVVTESDSVEEAAPDPAALGGVVLLGVVASGEQEAIIVRSEGKRLRLTAGDQIMGWTLLSVDTRSAEFTGAAGRVAKVDLALASNLALPKAAPGDPGSDEQPEIRWPEGTITFDNMYEVRESTSAGKPDLKTGKGGSP